MTVKRGDIYYADLSPVVGSEQGGIRPVLIVQNDVGNRFSPTVIAAAITSQKYKTNLPTHIRVNADGCGLAKDSIVLLEQVRTLDKKRLKEKMGALGGADMGRVDQEQQELLHALSPFLSQSRIGKLERAMRAAKMAGFASALLKSGGMNIFGGR